MRAGRGVKEGASSPNAAYTHAFVRSQRKRRPIWFRHRHLSRRSRRIPSRRRRPEVRTARRSRAFGEVRGRPHCPASIATLSIPGRHPPSLNSPPHGGSPERPGFPPASPNEGYPASTTPEPETTHVTPASPSPSAPRGTTMRWYHDDVAYFFGGAFLASDTPCF
jgi:hypothetical protein